VLIWALDDRPYDHCGHELAQVGHERGHDVRLFKRAEQVTAPGYVFMRLDQREPRLTFDRQQYSALVGREGLKFIQDPGQIYAYEDKLAQTRMWRTFMPETQIMTSHDTAQTYAHLAPYPIVSKSAIGSASHNVRLLQDDSAAQREIAAIFSKNGMAVSLGRQKDYWLIQRFVPHEVTYRVTAIGTKRHIYQRFNFKDRPMAAPSAVIPTQPLPMGPLAETVLEFSNKFFCAAATQWCAIDVIAGSDKLYLLETALGWARGNDASGNALFYDTKHSLLTQHELLLDEIEAGVFG
jgi:glutathione synthase/RimK-type ligase-like ATP-grasp enzyme